MVNASIHRTCKKVGKKYLVDLPFPARFWSAHGHFTSWSHWRGHNWWW